MPSSRSVPPALSLTTITTKTTTGEARLSYGTQGIIFSFWPSISTPPPATATLPTPLPLHRQPTNAPAAARRLTAILKSQEAAATAAGAKAGAKAGRGASPVPVPAPTRKAPFLKGPAAKGAGREGDESGATTASSSSSSDESTGGGGDDDGSGLLAPFPVLAAADADAAPRLSALSLGPLEGAGAGVGKVAMECAIPEWYTEEKTDEVAGDPGADGVGTPWPGLGPFVF